ncbi:hypothetical protein PPTG_02386 [Phytophthora nicotianae INRA-310]|uniref:AWS domain-containing protein n=1 Tax=Phytophthora nicotianae (strain INRA-310) TaxID=761204 RepID=W2RAQ0_PHYN3|nr:hypothetical protein PPTG_02386 [Phytophthora nicotianae INRA-310]ETN22452.1 hypothetical protein PPTG_02386 [Phytophthora nicotianae INRA-310]
MATCVVRIRSNFFVSNQPAPVFPEPDDYTCSCDNRMCFDEFGSSCGNFLSKIMCNEENCENGLGCGNRFICTHTFLIIPTITGLGLAATSPLVKGTFVLEYVGERIFEEKNANESVDASSP